MAAKYLYKCNPLVAARLGLSGFERYAFADGTLLLWEADIVRLDRERFYCDNDSLMADIGAVRLTDPQAAAEQRNPSVRLPEARLPEYRWTQPGGSGSGEGNSDTEDTEDGPTDGADGTGEVGNLPPVSGEGGEA